MHFRHASGPPSRHEHIDFHKGIGLENTFPRIFLDPYARPSSPFLPFLLRFRAPPRTPRPSLHSSQAEARGRRWLGHPSGECRFLTPPPQEATMREEYDYFWKPPKSPPGAPPAPPAGLEESRRLSLIPYAFHHSSQFPTPSEAKRSQAEQRKAKQCKATQNKARWKQTFLNTFPTRFWTAQPARKYRFS